MMSELQSLVTGEQVVTWLIIALLVVYIIYKEWPELKRRITSGTKKEVDDEYESKQVNERLGEIEKRVTSIDEKIQRDYDRLNRLESEVAKSRKSDQDSLEEREIIMRSLLGIIKGLQEIGANGPTKEAQAEIEKYLNSKAHETRAG